MRRPLQCLLTSIVLLLPVAACERTADETEPIAAEKPEGVPAENWLPIHRRDEDLNPVVRIYVPDLEKMKTWMPPKAEVIEMR